MDIVGHIISQHGSLFKISLIFLCVNLSSNSGYCFHLNQHNFHGFLTFCSSSRIWRFRNFEVWTRFNVWCSAKPFVFLYDGGALRTSASSQFLELIGESYLSPFLLFIYWFVVTPLPWLKNTCSDRGDCEKLDPIWHFRSWEKSLGKETWDPFLVVLYTLPPQVLNPIRCCFHLLLICRRSANLWKCSLSCQPKQFHLRKVPRPTIQKGGKRPIPPQPKKK